MLIIEYLKSLGRVLKQESIKGQAEIRCGERNKQESENA